MGCGLKAYKISKCQSVKVSLSLSLCLSLSLSIYHRFVCLFVCLFVCCIFPRFYHYRTSCNKVLGIGLVYNTGQPTFESESSSTLNTVFLFSTLSSHFDPESV
jgi:hypothetical protein